MILSLPQNVIGFPNFYVAMCAPANASLAPSVAQPDMVFR